VISRFTLNTLIICIIYIVGKTGCHSPYSFTVLESVSQCITVKVARGNNSWFCSGIYASPIISIREGLWDYLRDLRSRVNHSWVLLGDFNEILLPSEQRGGIFSQSRANKFSQVIDDCNLLDLHSFGRKYTWQANCRGGRLDRGLCDMDWRLKFPEATVEHLVRRQSDHNPILMKCHSRVSSREGRPFRFQAAWCSHEAYTNIVKKAWRKD